MINLYIGIDRYEQVAGHVALHSAMKRCSVPLKIVPLYKHNLHQHLWRKRDKIQSTDFAFSRFLVPYLSNFEGYSIFVDADVLVYCDLAELIELASKGNPDMHVWCVKHDYTPKAVEKFLHQKQSRYQKKNWSSVMVFNNAQCKILTPEKINKATGLWLHQFKWVGDDFYIGELPPEYNWLVGEYANNIVAKIYHFTNGIPAFDDFKDCDYAHLWWAEHVDMNSCIQEIQP